MVLISQYLFETFIDFDEERLLHTRAVMVCCHYLSRRVVRGFDKWHHNICEYISIKSCKERSQVLQYINSLDKRIDGVEFCTWLLITTKKSNHFVQKYQVMY